MTNVRDAIAELTAACADDAEAVRQHVREAMETAEEIVRTRWREIMARC